MSSSNLPKIYVHLQSEQYSLATFNYGLHIFDICIEFKRHQESFSSTFIFPGAFVLE